MLRVAGHLGRPSRRAVACGLLVAGAMGLVLGGAGCSATAMREPTVVVAFEEGEYARAVAEVQRERAVAHVDLSTRGFCALPTDDVLRWADVSPTRTGANAPLPPARERPAVERGLAPLGLRGNGAPRGLDWALDVAGVDVTRRDERRELAVTTRHGDWGGLERVVAWLERRGGRRVRPRRSRGRA